VRGIILARHAYRSRTGKNPPALAKARFESQDGETLETYTEGELKEL
jgi:hypothetical protein